MTTIRTLVLLSLSLMGCALTSAAGRFAVSAGPARWFGFNLLNEPTRTASHEASHPIF